MVGGHRQSLRAALAAHKRRQRCQRSPAVLCRNARSPILLNMIAIWRRSDQNRPNRLQCGVASADRHGYSPRRRRSLSMLVAHSRSKQPPVLVVADRGSACCASCGQCFVLMGARCPQMNEHFRELQNEPKVRSRCNSRPGLVSGVAAALIHTMETPPLFPTL